MTVRGDVVLGLALLVAFNLPGFAQAVPDTSPEVHPVCQISRDGRQPVIDVHLHPLSAEGVRLRRQQLGVDADRPDLESDTELLEVTLSKLDRHNVVVGVVDGSVPAVLRWTARAPGRLIGATSFRDQGVDSLRALHRSGQIKSFGEVNFQRYGLRPDDPAFEPYFALAEELDVPVGIHLYGGGAPGRSTFRVSLGDPILLEEVLVRHPRLRVYIMHAGMPFLDNTTAIMQQYPQVYADLSQISFARPREQFHDYLRSLIRAGLGKRLMFGSDPPRGPHVIALALEGITSAEFLSAEQQRDILCENAARFFRLDAATGGR